VWLWMTSPWRGSEQRACGFGEVGMGSCRWLGRDAEQGGGAAVVRLQRGEAWDEAVVMQRRRRRLGGAPERGGVRGLYSAPARASRRCRPSSTSVPGRGTRGANHGHLSQGARSGRGCRGAGVRAAAAPGSVLLLGLEWGVGFFSGHGHARTGPRPAGLCTHACGLRASASASWAALLAGPGWAAALVGPREGGARLGFCSLLGQCRKRERRGQEGVLGQAKA